MQLSTYNVHPLVVITGPTAVGKSALAITLAHELGAEIVSADSRQVFREMRIGTARTTEEELGGIACHLSGHRSVHDPYNTSHYEEEALAAIRDICARNRIPLLVGGTGLYIEAVCHGLDDMPEGDVAIRKELEEALATDGITALQEELERLDPAGYAIVDRRNPRRLIRAIEVSRVAGRPWSSLRRGAAKPREFRLVKIALDMEREELYGRINHRVSGMLERGLEEEARGLLPVRHLNALTATGYPEMFGYFDGACSLEEAAGRIRQNTRNYAKRQLTWLRRDGSLRRMRHDDVRGILELIREGGHD